MSFITSVQDKSEEFKISQKVRIGQISLNINQSNFDNYQRTYPRLQSLLVDVTSVISLLFDIGKIIANILCKKKMPKDIVGNISKKNKKIEKQSLNKKNKDTNKPFEIKAEAEEIYKSDNLKKNSVIKLRASSNQITKNETKDNEGNKVEKIFKKINYYHIFKSLFCFKERKTKFINLYNAIITEDICIERILERFNNLENVYKLNQEKDSFVNYNLINKYNEIIQYISNLDNDMKIESFIKDNDNNKQYLKMLFKKLEYNYLK